MCPLTTKELRKILELSDQGVCATHIAQQLNRSFPTVVKYLKSAGKYKPLPRAYFNPLSDKEKKKIVKLHKRGLSILQISIKVKRSDQTVRRFLKSLD